MRQVEYCEEPEFVKKSKKPTGRKLQGLKYEANVAKVLKRLYSECEVMHGPWIKYLNGPKDCKVKWAQPDVVIVPKRGPIVIVECKLTWRPGASEKLERLYGPLIKRLYPRRKVVLVQVCKNLTERSKEEGELQKLGELLKLPPQYHLCQFR
jgi:hypothetical protein